MEKNNGIIKTSLRLFVICFTTTILLAGVNLLTKDKIKENNEKKFQESCREVIEAEYFTVVDLSSYKKGAEGALAFSSDGEVLGLCVKQTVKGYNSGLVIMTGVLSDGNTISGIDIIEHSETPGFGALADTPEFTAQFKGISSPFSYEKEGGEIKAITGATKTSTGIKKCVNESVIIAGAYFEKEGKTGENS